MRMADVADYDRQDEPIEVQGAVSSHDLAVTDLRNWRNEEMVRAAIERLGERKAYGLNKYGVLLHKDNGRDHPLDAEDEAVDEVVYLRTWMDDCTTRGDFETAEWVWSMYQRQLWQFAAIAHYRKTGQRIPPIGRIDVDRPTEPSEQLEGIA
jgi:hypothetical protein